MDYHDHKHQEKEDGVLTVKTERERKGKEVLMYSVSLL